MTVRFKNINIPSATLVANEFIDDYMAKAHGEYVKVYLYLLRHATENIDEDDIADALDLMESDVHRALSYWCKSGLISVDDTAEEPTYESADEPAHEVKAMPIPVPAPDKSGIDMIRLKADDEFTELLYAVQRYLSKIFSQTDIETVAYLYDVLKMPKELIEYLVDISAAKGKSSLRYIEAIALDWHSKGIMSVEAAKMQSATYNKEVYAVMKAMGLDRNPGRDEELPMINKWYQEYGFTMDIITEACNRTLAAISKPSFAYADSILTRWHDAGVKHMSDIAKLDEEHDAQSQAKVSSATLAKKKANRFNNFEQRDDDLDSRVLDKLNRKLKES